MGDILGEELGEELGEKLDDAKGEAFPLHLDRACRPLGLKPELRHPKRKLAMKLSMVAELWSL